MNKKGRSVEDLLLKQGGEFSIKTMETRGSDSKVWYPKASKRWFIGRYRRVPRQQLQGGGGTGRSPEPMPKIDPRLPVFWSPTTATVVASPDPVQPKGREQRAAGRGYAV